MTNLNVLFNIIFFALPIALAFICLYYALFFLKRARLLQDIPTSKIRSAAQGYVELSGQTKSLLKQPILGYLTETPCAWYFYTTEYFQTTANANQNPTGGWTFLEKGISKEPFLLVDETGECVILPFNAEVITFDVTLWRGHKRIADPPTKSFFYWLFSENLGPYRYTEQQLALNTPIYASGHFKTVDRENPFIQADPKLKAYCIEKNLSHIHILSAEHLDKNEHFVISAVAEKKLSTKLTLKAFIFFIAFLIFTFVIINSTYPIAKKALQPWAYYFGE